MDEYYKYFQEIKAYAYFNKKDYGHSFVLSHCPLHPMQGYPKYVDNVHGHIHEKWILTKDTDPVRYYNLSVERHDYTPVHLDEIIKYFHR